MKRVASLDLLRGVAALAVAVPHYLIINSTGHPVAKVTSVVSVEIFFALSGFVLAPQIINCVRFGAWTNLRIFLVRRWMRTVFPYWVALLAILLITAQLGTFDFLRYAVYVQNLFSQANHNDYFPVAWSLSVEEWFYVTFPLFVFLSARLVGQIDKRFFFTAALLFIGLIVIGRMIAGSHENWDEEVRRVVVFRVDSIAFGFCLYLLIDQYGQQQSANPPLAKVLPSVLFFIAAAAAGFAVAWSAVISKNPIGQQLFPFVAALFGMGTVAMFYQLRRLSEGDGAITRFCLYMGRISYSIYLFHLILILLLEPVLRPYALPLQLAIYLGSMVLFSSVFYHYFERPILRARPKYRFDTSEPKGVPVVAQPLQQV